MDIGRNDPCPCGSGLKYKKCHLGKSLPTDEVVVAESAAAHRDRRQAVILALVGVAVAVAAGFFRGAYTGIVVGAAWALGLVAYLSFRNPPPPNENAGDPAALDFGRSRDDR